LERPANIARACESLGPSARRASPGTPRKPRHAALANLVDDQVDIVAVDLGD
jgi:hypothetical protein